jgi:hypothetical protein
VAEGVGFDLTLISLRFFRKSVKLFTAKSRQLPQTEHAAAVGHRHRKNINTLALYFS